MNNDKTFLVNKTMSLILKIMTKFKAKITKQMKIIIMIINISFSNKWKRLWRCKKETNLPKVKN
jgi:hypothetical protein